MKRYVIGLECGESGGRELCGLLRGIPGSFITFQRDWESDNSNSGLLPWIFNESLAKRKLSSIKSDDSLVLNGDIAHYYMNYIEYFMVNLPELKVICTYGDKRDTVNKLLKSIDLNVFLNNDTREAKTYPIMTPALAEVINNPYDIVASYYDFYSNCIDSLLIYYPKRVIAVMQEDLDKSETQKVIYSFLGI